MSASRFVIDDRLVLGPVMTADGELFLMDLLGKTFIINPNQISQSGRRPRFGIPMKDQCAALPLGDQQARPFEREGGTGTYQELLVELSKTEFP